MQLRPAMGSDTQHSIPNPNFASDLTLGETGGGSLGDLYGDVEEGYAREKHNHPLTFRAY